jgi:hypothetical protein
MEYVELLDIAVTKTDSWERAAYVAAFAASEYASTVNRVAKPFNPLLVCSSHNSLTLARNVRVCTTRQKLPFYDGASQPSSTNCRCICRFTALGLLGWSNLYPADQKGEQNVKTKFTGTAFDVNHLGTWYCRLRVVDGSEEIYTWKKTNQAVVGILKGSPVVDKYCALKSN